MVEQAGENQVLSEQAQGEKEKEREQKVQSMEYHRQVLKGKLEDDS